MPKVIGQFGHTDRTPSAPSAAAPAEQVERQHRPGIGRQGHEYIRQIRIPPSTITWTRLPTDFVISFTRMHSD